MKPSFVLCGPRAAVPARKTSNELAESEKRKEAAKLALVVNHVLLTQLEKLTRRQTSLGATTVWTCRQSGPLKFSPLLMTS
ncbi:hypothetical protein AVEN_146937-1 [Araneus ventricosus]|uniref:Uncharacterized protein n=1 Tax=Araneus ventricosus TaxID=182803 RepID=A0A4Y2M2Q9_ARAVE|nr:hypothetical protein AVEN_146937-1 [Araneus ventricosus]